MKTTIQTIIALGALAFMGASANAAAASSCATCKSCAPTGSRKVVLDGKVVVVADCKHTRGVRSVRMVKVR